MKRIIILVLVLIWGTNSASYGQRSKIRLLYSSADISQLNRDTLDIKRVRHATFSDSLVVRLKNKQKLVLAPNQIWGYQDEDNELYRYYDGEFYHVRQIDGLILYSRKPGKYTYYYFSQGGDGKLLSLNSSNLKKEFGNNPCFLNKMENDLKWYQDYSSYNDRTQSYRMIEFYKSCNGNTL